MDRHDSIDVPGIVINQPGLDNLRGQITGFILSQAFNNINFIDNS